MSEGEMLEVNGVQVFYADDIGEVEIIGNRVRVTFVEYRRVRGVLVKQPVVDIIRPLDSARKQSLWKMITEALNGAGEISDELVLTH